MLRAAACSLTRLLRSLKQLDALLFQQPPVPLLGAPGRGQVQETRGELGGGGEGGAEGVRREREKFEECYEEHRSHGKDLLLYLKRSQRLAR
eukprot:768707-Hanusia_phi.AAC.9